MIDTFLLSFIPLFVAFDVLGVLPVYIKLTASMDHDNKTRHLRDSLLTAFIISMLFVIVGNRVMTYLGISMQDFLVAGGIVIFITAIRDLIQGHGEPAQGNEFFGVVPLGIPLLAGPAVLATSMIIWSQHPFYYYLISRSSTHLLLGRALLLGLHPETPRPAYRGGPLQGLQSHHSLHSDHVHTQGDTGFLAWRKPYF